MSQVQFDKQFAYHGDSICFPLSEGFNAVAFLEHDHDAGPPWENDTFAEETDAASIAWKNDEWFYCGVCVDVVKNGVTLTKRYRHALWGVECNYPGSDNSYLGQVARDLAEEALIDAKATIAKLNARANGET